MITVSVTEAGRHLARRLPGEHLHGSLADTVRRRWHDTDAFVLFVAVGAAVRVVGPLLADKARDPAVLCVDQGGRWVVPVAGGHRGGANDLARTVAAALGATAVITTASETTGLPPLDTLEGFAAAGDVAGVVRRFLDGEQVVLRCEVPGWTLPPAISAATVARDATGPALGSDAAIVVTDRAVTAPPGTAVLHPRSLVVGVGASTGAPAAEIAGLVERAVRDAGLARAAVDVVATIDRRAQDPGILALGLPVRAYTAEHLRTIAVPTPSPVVERAVGSPSVAEAAALAAAGPGGTLIVSKRVGAHATVALARRARPRGHLALVGLGPGHAAYRTPAATGAVRRADVVIGYRPYVAQAADLLTAAHEVLESAIGDEVLRAQQAVAEAEAGRRVALVCSGDAGVYGMASLVLEVAGGRPLDADVEVVPGVTASVAAAALLGAPLGHDHCAVSLSDLLTPWEVIEKRVRGAAAADLVLVLYNPRSRGRPDHLDRVRRIVLAHRPATTPVGVVTDAYRPAQRVCLTTLGELDVSAVGMTTVVVVGASATAVVAGRMVTPRGYEP